MGGLLQRCCSFVGGAARCWLIVPPLALRTCHSPSLHRCCASADDSHGEEERGSGKRRREERRERSRDRSDRRRKDSRWAVL